MFHCRFTFAFQFYQQEAAKLRSQIGNLQNSNRYLLWSWSICKMDFFSSSELRLIKLIIRNMLGESLSALSVKELKSLEIKLEKGISRIRSKKVFILVLNILLHYITLISLALPLTNYFFCFLIPPSNLPEWAVVCWNWVYAEEGNNFCTHINQDFFFLFFFNRFVIWCLPY